MKLSPRGQQVLIDREGCVLTAYQDSTGVWTCGVGHTSTAGDPEVVEGTVFTMPEAWHVFAQDVAEFEDAVNDAITAEMTQNEYDAFVSICFNIGETQFRSATFVEQFNAGESKDEVTASILAWNIPPEIIPRRQGEATQFRDGVYVARIDPMPPPSEEVQL